jgi:hypothetical protein
MRRGNTKWERRDRKRHKQKNGMKISGRSVLTIVDIQRKRAEEVRHEAVTKRS